MQNISAFPTTCEIFKALVVVGINDNILVFSLGKSSIELLEAKTSHVNDNGRLLRREMLPRRKQSRMKQVVSLT